MAVNETHLEGVAPVWGWLSRLPPPPALGVLCDPWGQLWGHPVSSLAQRLCAQAGSAPLCSQEQRGRGSGAVPFVSAPPEVLQPSVLAQEGLGGRRGAGVRAQHEGQGTKQGLVCWDGEEGME